MGRFPHHVRPGARTSRGTVLIVACSAVLASACVHYVAAANAPPPPPPPPRLSLHNATGDLLNGAIRYPPPEPYTETVPARPDSTSTWAWVPGGFKWDGTTYVWVPGEWVVPPPGRHQWTAGSWNEKDDGTWAFTPGSWH